MITFVRLLTFVVPVAFLAASVPASMHYNQPWFVVGIVGAVGIYGGGMLLAHEMRGDHR